MTFTPRAQQGRKYAWSATAPRRRDMAIKTGLTGLALVGVVMAVGSGSDVGQAASEQSALTVDHSVVVEAASQQPQWIIIT